TAALTVKAVERLAGSGTRFAYAVKAGPWIFLNGHEAFDFERGLAPEVEGPSGHRLSGRPPLRREADYILQRLRTILKEFGYNPAVVVNDFVFVAGNQAFVESGELGPGVAMPPARNWGGESAFRRQAHYVIRERLEPSLKAAGSALEHSLKAQVYIRGVDNFPDFIDVWSQYFRDIPCALTLVPAQDYSSTESM